MSWLEPKKLLPVAPGASAFRVKGHALRSGLKQYDAFVPGGRAAVLDAIDRPDLRVYLLQRFLASSWYDMLPLAYLDMTAAEVAGVLESSKINRRITATLAIWWNGAFDGFIKFGRATVMVNCADSSVIFSV